MTGAWVIAKKDLRVLSRDRMALFWVIGFPLLFAVFLGAVLQAGIEGSNAALRVKLVDKDRSALSLRLVSMLRTSPSLSTEVVAEAAAVQAIRRGKAVAAIVVSDGWAKSVAERRPQSISVIVDPARELEGGRLGAVVQEVLEQALNRSANTKPRLFEIRPLRVDAVARGAQGYVFAPAVLWGLIGCTACFAVSLVAERTRGTLKRLGAAPVPRSSILLGKALACLVACALVSLILTVIAWVVFSVRVDAPFKLMIGLGSAAVCFAGITMLLSVLGRTEQSVAGAGWASLIILAMFGGGMVPLSLMPAWMSNISYLSPVRWGIVALEGAVWRGFSYQELLQSCSILVVTGAGAFALGSAFFNRSFE